MASYQQWVDGARPKTLAAAAAPVIVGTGAAAHAGGFHLGHALLAACVAFALQIGVNYANDYSDGIRGTDLNRVGPIRLTASGLARPNHVRLAAFICFGLAGLCGLVLTALTAHWWLIAVGAACVAAAWFYTGGKKPYGYAGLGDVGVFIFFGLVATLGTQFTQAGGITALGFVGACAMGLLACAILMVNNIRDIPGDTLAGKRTLAVKLGAVRAAKWYTSMLWLPLLTALYLGFTTSGWMFLVIFLMGPAVILSAAVHIHARIRVNSPGLLDAPGNITTQGITGPQGFISKVTGPVLLQATAGFQLVYALIFGLSIALGIR